MDVFLNIHNMAQAIILAMHNNKNDALTAAVKSAYENSGKPKQAENQAFISLYEKVIEALATLPTKTGPKLQDTNPLRATLVKIINAYQEQFIKSKSLQAKGPSP